MASYTAEQLQQSFGIPAASAQALLSRLNTISSSASEGEGSGGVANSFSPVSPGISGLGFSGLNPGGFDADASIGPTTSNSGFSGFGDTVGSAISGVGDTVGSALSSSFSTPFGDVTLSDVALSLGLSAFTGIPGLGLVAQGIAGLMGPSQSNVLGQTQQSGVGNLSIDAFGNPVGSTRGDISAMTAFNVTPGVNRGLQDPMGVIGGFGSTGDAQDSGSQDSGSGDAPGAGTDAGNVGHGAGEGTAEEGEGDPGQADSSMGGISGEEDGVSGGFADGGIMQLGGSEPNPTAAQALGFEPNPTDVGIMGKSPTYDNMLAQRQIGQLGGSSTNQPRLGVDTSNFYLRTPEQGFSLRTSPATFVEGKQPSTGSSRLPEERLNLTGNYGRSTSEVTPEALSIPQETIDRFRFQNQEKKSTSYNVGIRAMFPDGVVPDFMDRVLRPKSANVSFGQTESESRYVQGDTSTSSDRSRGIGGQGQVLRAMFGDNAPTVGFQYYEPKKFDKQISGNVNIPVGKGNLDFSAARNINEGRDNSESFEAGLNLPVGFGTISADGEFYRDPETGQDENRFGARLRVPLN